MKAFVKKVTRDERGAGVLALVLVLLVVGGLILTPLLGLMSTGLMAGQVYERKTHELYAADAGVEDAIWRIQTNNLTFLNDSSGPWHLTVNDRSIEVVVYRHDWDGTPCGENMTYQILSTAVTDDASGTAGIESATTVEAYVEPLVFDLLSGALVSMSYINFQSDQHPCNVTGDVYYVTKIEGDYEHSVPPERIPLESFPSEDENLAFAQVFKDEAMAGQIHTGDWTIDSDMTLNATYITGDLHIQKQGNNGATVTLTGPIYVEGSIDVDAWSEIAGSGSIVAVGNIGLAKMPYYGVEGDTVIMSVSGDITFKKDAIINAFVYAPKGHFEIDKAITVLGGLIGESIQIDKEGSFTYVSKASSFGLFEPVVYGAEIKTYTINPVV